MGSPLLLRKLVAWFSGWESSDGDETAFPVWQGWMWSGLLALMGYLYCLVHHQLFWKGMRNGFTMRLQAIAAVQGKVLRLNGAGVAAVTAGKIINLVSNDVRRFDEAGTFAVFLLAGPVELGIVLVLIGLKMGFAASVAGVATSLLLIPIQARRGRGPRMMETAAGGWEGCKLREADEQAQLAFLRCITPGSCCNLLTERMGVRGTCCCTQAAPVCRMRLRTRDCTSTIHRHSRRSSPRRACRRGHSPFHPAERSRHRAFLSTLVFPTYSQTARPSFLPTPRGRRGCWGGASSSCGTPLRSRPTSACG